MYMKIKIELYSKTLKSSGQVFTQQVFYIKYLLPSRTVNGGKIWF